MESITSGRRITKVDRAGPATPISMFNRFVKHGILMWESSGLGLRRFGRLKSPYATTQTQKWPMTLFFFDNSKKPVIKFI
jgi:hypothetical protein